MMALSQILVLYNVSELYTTIRCVPPLRRITDLMGSDLLTNQLAAAGISLEGTSPTFHKQTKAGMSR